MMSLYISFFFSFCLVLYQKKPFWSEMSYFMFFIMFYILTMMPLGSGFKMVDYNIGLDNMSLSLNVLSLWVTILMIYSSTLIFLNKNSDNFFILVIFILLLTLLISFFSMNLFMFYFFFEFSLIPTLILIMGWGYQPERIQAGVYFLFYTLMASLPLLLSLFYVYTNLGSLYLYMFEGVILKSNLSLFFFLSMVLAFLVKMPMFMTHLWLPKAHVEAPVSGSMILAGVLLKLGGFGLCRVMGLIYMYLTKFSSYFIGLSLMGMTYVGFICCRLNDMKALVAYSSVSHMALVISGVFSYYSWGFSGALSMMIAHGVSSSGLFCILNMYYERSHSRSIFLNKGLMLISSSMTLMFFMLCIANISAPPTINLLSEVLLMASIMSFDFFMVLVFPLGSFLGAVFTFYIFSFTQHGQFFFLSSSKLNCTIKELNILMMHIVPLNLIILVPEMFLLF